MTILADPHAAGFYERMGARFLRMAPSDTIPGRELPFYGLDLDPPVGEPQHELDAPPGRVGLVAGLRVGGAGGQAQAAVDARQPARVSARVEGQGLVVRVGSVQRSAPDKGASVWSGSNARFRRARIAASAGLAES